MGHVKQPRDQTEFVSQLQNCFSLLSRGSNVHALWPHNWVCSLYIVSHKHFALYWLNAFILHKQELHRYLCASVDPYTLVMYCWFEIAPLLLQGCRSLFKGFSFLMLGYRGKQMETDILSSLIQHMYCNCFFWQRSITHAHCSRSATNVFKSNLMNS